MAQYKHFVKILGWSEHCIRWKLFSVFQKNLDFWWRSMTSNTKFPLWSRYRSGHNGRLHAKFQPFIPIFITKCSLTKFGVPVSNCPQVLQVRAKNVFAFQYYGLTSPWENLCTFFYFHFFECHPKMHNAYVSIDFFFF